MSQGYRRSWPLKTVCVYNFLAILLTILGEISKANVSTTGGGHFMQPYFFLIGGALTIQLASTIGLWYGRSWAFVVQFFFYFLQSILFQARNITYSLIIGPHYYVNLNLNFPAEKAVIGFNIIAIALLILLLLSFNVKLSGNVKTVH